jgi:hypothetical protein
MTSRTAAGSCHFSPLRAIATVRLCGRKRHARCIPWRLVISPKDGFFVEHKLSIYVCPSNKPVKCVWNGIGIERKTIVIENFLLSEKIKCIRDLHCHVTVEVLLGRVWSSVLLRRVDLGSFWPSPYYLIFHCLNIRGGFSFNCFCSWHTFLNSSSSNNNNSVT